MLPSESWLLPEAMCGSTALQRLFSGVMSWAPIIIKDPSDVHGLVSLISNGQATVRAIMISMAYGTTEPMDSVGLDYVDQD